MIVLVIFCVNKIFFCVNKIPRTQKIQCWIPISQKGLCNFHSKPSSCSSLRPNWPPQKKLEAQASLDHCWIRLNPSTIWWWSNWTLVIEEVGNIIYIYILRGWWWWWWWRWCIAANTPTFNSTVVTVAWKSTLPITSLDCPWHPEFNVPGRRIHDLRGHQTYRPGRILFIRILGSCGGTPKKKAHGHQGCVNNATWNSSSTYRLWLKITSIVDRISYKLLWQFLCYHLFLNKNTYQLKIPLAAIHFKLCGEGHLARGLSVFEHVLLLIGWHGWSWLHNHKWDKHHCYQRPTSRDHHKGHVGNLWSNMWHQWDSCNLHHPEVKNQLMDSIPELFEGDVYRLSFSLKNRGSCRSSSQELYGKLVVWDLFLGNKSHKNCMVNWWFGILGFEPGCP